MRRIAAANATPDNKFQDADPGSGQRATSLNAQWCNDVQESLVHPVLLASLTPNGDANQFFKAIVNLVYRVGDYIHSENPESPAVVFNWQIWVEVKGRVLVGFDDAQTEFNALGKEGGDKAVTLTADQMPSHTHSNVNGAWISADNGSAPQAATFDATGTGSNNGRSVSTTSSGGGQSDNNLQPYRVTYIWRRTA